MTQQHDDHVQRRLAIRAGLLGLARRPNMSVPEYILRLDEGEAWDENGKGRVNVYDHYQKPNWALP